MVLENKQNRRYKQINFIGLQNKVLLSVHHGGQPAPQVKQCPIVRKVLTTGVKVGTGVGALGSSPDLQGVMSRDHKHLEKELLWAIKLIIN